MDILTIKNNIKEYIKLIYTCPDYWTILKQLKNKTSQKIVLFGTPAHGNLGDHAIAISELDFLQRTSEGHNNIVEIPMPLFKTYRKKIRNRITPKDKIIISGGGWMGNLWIHNEITIRQIIMDYPKNKIIIFPQTLYYTNDEYGNKTALESRNIFSKHKNLFLFVRDEKSYEYAKSKLGFHCEKNLFFCPDMVIFGTLAQKNISTSNLKTALICLRNDIEKTANTANVKNILSDAGFIIKETTTVLNKHIPLRKRVQIVQKKLSEFQAPSIVVTDRLHAMLFAVLTGTPCIAFDNATGKVFGVAEYLIKGGIHIKLVAQIKSIDLINIELKKTEYTLSDNLKKYFSKLSAVVNFKEEKEK